ncbi:GNAT family N-acetyltransferase [Vibrio sp. SCSIO 43136]|uniref:GNAT family N-acetyltransferase n=1 Tax=Vibrio sp. SCSIO 43136 TaxID=2819101 RepID=UPI00207582E3|nr:GNAT family N-acetyltransferase [Vibrio sp. SCSIO 43136]USD67671.1 GNAT family N-acetyltransferase [Vibrio sp. SCSIO 43136]
MRPTIHFSTRDAGDLDYDFLFELKKAAEYDAVKRVFGWDEALQRELHHQEWLEAKPNIVMYDNQDVGSFLLEQKTDHLYLARLFLLPQFQGQGLGSAILEHCIRRSNQASLPIKLCHLQGNKVNRLYQKFGFQVEWADTHFIYMNRPND